jgi:hypothetical protein
MTQFRYVRFIQNDGSVGYATFAFDKVKKQGNKLDFTFGVSFCSPKDFFDKHIGRKKAESMLSGKRTRKPLTITIDKDINSNRISNKEFWCVLEHFLSKEYSATAIRAELEIPHWAYRCWNRGNVSLSTSPAKPDKELYFAIIKAREAANKHRGTKMGSESAKLAIWLQELNELKYGSVQKSL